MPNGLALPKTCVEWAYNFGCFEWPKTPDRWLLTAFVSISAKISVYFSIIFFTYSFFKIPYISQ